MERYSLNGFSILEVEETASTNTFAAELPPKELGDKDVVLTFHQTQGRGQAGNKWESAPGKNISITVVFKPARLDAGRQFAVSMVIALACRDFISRYVDGCTVKWPNDVYVGDRKIVGILIEHTVSGAYVGRSLCGIGLNVNQPEFLSDAPNPVSLFQLLGHELPLREALADFLECIDRRYAQIQEYSLLERDFMQSLYRRNGMYDWQDEAGVFCASVVGIDEYGRLVLKDTGGVRRVYGFKEVKFL